MRVLTIACILVAAAGTAGAAPTSDEPVAKTLDLVNWGLGIFYIHGGGLGQELNGIEGWQETPTETAEATVPGDLLVLP